MPRRVLRAIVASLLFLVGMLWGAGAQDALMGAPPAPWVPPTPGEQAAHNLDPMQLLPVELELNVGGGDAQRPMAWRPSPWMRVGAHIRTPSLAAAVNERAGQGPGVVVAVRGNMTAGGAHRRAVGYPLPRADETAGQGGAGASAAPSLHLEWAPSTALEAVGLTCQRARAAPPGEIRHLLRPGRLFLSRERILSAADIVVEESPPPGGWAEGAGAVGTAGAGGPLLLPPGAARAGGTVTLRFNRTEVPGGACVVDAWVEFTVDASLLVPKWKGGDAERDRWRGTKATPSTTTALKRVDSGPRHDALAGASIGGQVTAAVWCDVDMDGADDLFLAADGRPNRLFYNRGGTLEEARATSSPDLFAAAARKSRTMWAGCADLDSDGDPDVVTVGYAGNVLLENVRGALVQVDGGDLTADQDQTSCAALGDVNGDGLPDLYVGNWDSPNLIYLNGGRLPSINATDGAPGSGGFNFTRNPGALPPPLPGAGWPMGSVMGDYSGDSILDL